MTNDGNSPSDGRPRHQCDAVESNNKPSIRLMSILRKSTQTHSSIQITFDQMFSPAAQTQKLLECVDAHTETLDIALHCTARKISPSHILALRNALLLIPENIRLRTVAMTSLSPFICAVWLIGDERWIADDAAIWIPQLSEEILRGHPRDPREREAPRLVKRTPLPEENHSGDKHPETHYQALSNDFSLSEKRKQRVLNEFHDESLTERECGCHRCRTVTELKSVSCSINGWFPCWEYSGHGIIPEDLVSMNIIKPEWIFGTKSSLRASARLL